MPKRSCEHGSGPPRVFILIYNANIISLKNKKFNSFCKKSSKRIKIFLRIILNVNQFMKQGDDYLGKTAV